MNFLKLVPTVAFLGMLGLGAHATANAASCTSPQEAWLDEATCAAGSNHVYSKGYLADSNHLGLQVWSADLTGCASYIDAYGYSSTGLRKVLCNPTGGLVNGVCYNYGADDTNCNGSVTHDAYGDWP
jgi:hypothetical protein